MSSDAQFAKTVILPNLHLWETEKCNPAVHTGEKGTGLGNSQLVCIRG